MLPQAQPEPLCLSWDLAGGLVAVMSQMCHWELWGFSTAAQKYYPLTALSFAFCIKYNEQTAALGEVVSKTIPI